MSAPQTGTTIVAVSFADGVVIGADSRVTTGTYVSNRASDKLTPLDEDGFIYLGRSGSAADTQLVADYVRYWLEHHSLEEGAPATVHAAAKLVAKVVACLLCLGTGHGYSQEGLRYLVNLGYENKKMLSAAMLVAGWDAVRGPQVYGVPISGTLVEQKWSTDGSGSTYIWGYLDSAYREGMAQGEAEEVVATALALAMARDGSSGGMSRLATITRAGCARRLIRGNEQPPLWDELAPPRAPPPAAEAMVEA